MNIKHHVEKFWQLFSNEHKRIQNALIETNQEVLHSYIDKLHMELHTFSDLHVQLEYTDDQCECTFLCGCYKSNQILAALLKKHAPKNLLDDWIINPYRMSDSQLSSHVCFEVQQNHYDKSDFHIEYTVDESQKGLYLSISCEGLSKLETFMQEKVVSQMLEIELGELELEARILGVSIVETIKAEKNGCELSDLFTTLIAIIEQQDWQEYHDVTSIYRVYKIEQAHSSQGIRKDIKLITSKHYQFHEEWMAQKQDIAKEFIQWGGEFGYIYYEVMYTDEKEAFMRQELEKSINELVFDLGIAFCIGGALGEFYSYIDLAIFDKEACNIFLKKLQKKMNFTIYYRSFIEQT